jgi:hypothetical protein
MVRDQSGLPGVVCGNASWTADGRTGGALHFDGWDDHLNIPHDPAIEIGRDNADFSVAFWIKLQQDPIGAWRSLFHKGNRNYQRTFSMWFRPLDNRLHYRATTTQCENEGGDSKRPVSLNVWTHVACVKAGSRLTLYLDGEEDSSVSLGGVVLSNDGPLYVGKDPWYAGTKSTLDDIRIYNRALPPCEIRQIAQPMTR